MAEGFASGMLVGASLVGIALLLLLWWGLRKVVRLERRAAHVERMGELGMLTAGLAHEIKNPLSTLQLNLQLLREELDDRVDRLEATATARGPELDERRRVLARMRRRLDGVHKEAGRLREILDGFLRYAGQIEPQLSAVAVDEVTLDLVDFLSPQASASRVTLDTAGVRPAVANADANLLKQALLNLLLNAVQHTPAGGTVRVAVEPRGREIAIAVADTGPGISIEDRSRLFDPYYTRRKGGTGLGLAITKRIAEAHAGRIEVSGELGKGAIFTLTLPKH